MSNFWGAVQMFQTTFRYRMLSIRQKFDKPRQPADDIDLEIEILGRKSGNAILTEQGRLKFIVD